MLEEQLQTSITFLQSNPIVAAIIACVLAVLFFCKPKEMFKLLAFCLFMAFVFYCISIFAGTVNSGSKQKDQMIYKTQKALGE